MRMLVVVLAIIVTATTFAPSVAHAWRSEFRNFDGCFEKVPNLQPKSIKLVHDPTDPANPNEVISFTVVPKKCIGPDCDQQSARSAVKQCEGTKQPKEIWYGWEMFLPVDFPHNGEQIRGFQQFVQWKDQPQCRLVGLAIDANLGGTTLDWGMEKPTGVKPGQYGGDCQQIMKYQIAKVSNLLGKWQKFELFARWSEGDDGRFVLYLNGEVKVDYRGITCFNCGSRNAAAFGNYICCTPDSKRLLPSTVYYRSISSAKRREDLIWE